MGPFMAVPPEEAGQACWPRPRPLRAKPTPSVGDQHPIRSNDGWTLPSVIIESMTFYMAIDE